MAFDSTIGGANANSYPDVSRYKTYAALRLPALAAALPPAASDSAIEVALQIGTRMIDQDFDWTGMPTDPASDDPTSHQALCWPRKAMTTRNGFNIASTVLPRELLDAACEIAYQLLGGADLIGDDDAAKNNLLGLSAGAVKLTFQRDNTATQESVDMILRRLGSEFNYLSRQITGEVRRLLVPSWYNQPTIIRPVLFGAFGSGRAGRR